MIFPTLAVALVVPLVAAQQDVVILVAGGKSAETWDLHKNGNPNANFDDTELLRLSSNYSTVTQCAVDPATLIGNYSLIYPFSVLSDQGNPLVCGGGTHWQGAAGFTKNCYEYFGQNNSLANLGPVLNSKRKGGSVVQFDNGTYAVYGGINRVSDKPKVIDFLYDSEIYVNGQWSRGAGLGISQRSEQFACGVSLKGHNTIVVFYDHPELYNVTSGQWTTIDHNGGMLFGGRGYACHFHENSTNSRIILAGGDKGQSQSQILDLTTFLDTGNKTDIPAWQWGPSMNDNMVDSAYVPLDDGSFLMIGSRAAKGKPPTWLSSVYRFDPVADEYVLLSDSALRHGRSEHVAIASPNLPCDV